MSKRIILSLDYDSHADALFYDAEKQRPDYMPAVIKGAQLAFDDYFTQIGARDNATELYVGSIRQDITIDEQNGARNGNGRCFAFFKKLAVKKNWTFNKLLYADKNNRDGKEYPAGTAMADKNKRARNNNQKLFDSKVPIIQMQLDDIVAKYPNDEIDFYFSDDKESILTGLSKKFKDKYKHVNLHFVQFDWFALAEETEDQLEEKKVEKTTLTTDYYREKALAMITKVGDPTFKVSKQAPRLARIRMLPDHSVLLLMVYLFQY